MPALDYLTDATEGYSPAQDTSLAGYSALVGIFGVASGALLLAARERRGGLPERYHVLDVVTVGIATHKLARALTKAKATAFIRAPFTRFEGPAGRGEVVESARGEGLRRTVGELLTCPYCISQWLVAGFGIGMVAAPRPTRFVAFIYSAEAAADFLQVAYKRLDG